MLELKTQISKLKSSSYQIINILAVWGCAYVLQKLLNLPVTSGVLGFFLLLFLLKTNWLKFANVEQGANFLLSELLLFFIPPVVGVIQYQNLLIASGCKILLVILISTLLVMMTSVYTVKLFLNHASLKQEKEYD
ncbi:holin-like protein [Acinetobacter baylyi]|uniref:Holin-like protein n=1 Tax=Acinetobacter baylyi TaxID=202950 RepID=A0ABU0US39_ACIBI|nr:CidA/LrgA family protein [Acinetobacter baylyi]MDQ1207118.1 holin-like protein [Acinetobacter baylyi]MDR6108273.1 holin-like protein [Acinetobacter baylyi]MDR6184137.1 holin-like protein [Acinetobacter baylyi]